MAIRLRTAHTPALDTGGLRAVRALLEQAFEGEFDDDWDHGLGGRVMADPWTRPMSSASAGVTAMCCEPDGMAFSQVGAV